MFAEYKNEIDYKEQNGYDHEGTWYPRVTKIVGIKAKPALYRYYGDAQSYASAKASTERSAEEGTLVHEAVEALLLGKTPEVDSIILPAVNAFREFALKKNISTEPEFVERRIVHGEHRYAGTIDALAFIDGKFGVLDIKTSSGIYRDYNLQTSAYVEALLKDFPEINTRWILRLDQIENCLRCGATRRVKGGNEKVKKPYGWGVCKIHEWGEVEGIAELKEFPDWKPDFEAFLGAKRLWEWENEPWLKKIGYLG